MSFDVFIFASTTSPHGAHYVAEFRAGLAHDGAKVDKDIGYVTARDGGDSEIFGADEGGAMFALRGLTPGMCNVIYNAAAATKSYIVSTGDDSLPALRTPAAGTFGGSKDFKVVRIKSAAELCHVLSKGFEGWSEFLGHVRKATR